MTARRKVVARRPQPGPESEHPGWPGVVRHALDGWPRTIRLCVIVVVVGIVLAALLFLRFWT